MLGGYALCSGMTLYGQLKERVHQRGMTQAQPDQVQEARQAVEGANAYTTYEKLSALILMAMEMTLVLLYTFLAISTRQMLGYMIVALACTLLTREAAEYYIKRRERSICMCTPACACVRRAAACA